MDQNLEINVLKSSDLSGNQIKVIPFWKEAFYRKYKDVSIVEVPILTQGRYGYVTMENQLAYENYRDDRYLQSLTRIVIIRRGRDDRTIGFFMTLVPDTEFRENNNHRVFSSSYGAWQKNYSGLLLYNKLDGSYLNGWKLDGKKVTHTLQVMDNTDTNLDLKIIPSKTVEACSDYYMTIWTQSCTDWYLNGSYTNTTCDAGSRETVFMYRLCSYSGGGSGSVFGGTNYDKLLFGAPSGNENGAIPCEGDPFSGIIGVAPTPNSGILGGTFGCVRFGCDPARCDSTHSYHGGLDLICDQNTTIYSMLSGTVIKAVKSFGQNEYAKRSFGNYITIRHTYPDRRTVDITYAHLNSVNYSVGDNVGANILIGSSGKTGNAASDDILAHLHLEVKVNGVAVDPASYLASVLSSNGTVIVPCGSSDLPFMND